MIQLTDILQVFQLLEQSMQQLKFSQYYLQKSNKLPKFELYHMSR